MAEDSMEESKFYVYVWFDSDSLPFYVGKGTGNRWKSESDRNYLFLKQLESDDRCYPRKHKTQLTSAEALELEKDLIERLKPRCNIQLVNTEYKDVEPNETLEFSRILVQRLRRHLEKLSSFEPLHRYKTCSFVLKAIINRFGKTRIMREFGITSDSYKEYTKELRECGIVITDSQRNWKKAGRELIRMSADLEKAPASNKRH